MKCAKENPEELREKRVVTQKEEKVQEAARQMPVASDITAALFDQRLPRAHIWTEHKPV